MHKKILGLIVEYNPFHNGHLYHLNKAKELAQADYTICVMSGNFIQRGEPAIVNKWARTKMALHNGVDVVIELPFVYAMASAEYFAFGAVKILDSLGIVDCICFGSENGRIEELSAIANVLSSEPDKFKNTLKNELAKGISYPSARECALLEYFDENISSHSVTKETIASSNNILGIEYIKALNKIDSNITPLTIDRINNNYNSETMTGGISSATAVRKFILENGFSISDGFIDSMPKKNLEILSEEFSHGRGPVFAKDYGNIILGLLRRMTPVQLKEVLYVSEGLENRIIKSVENSGSFEELIQGICTKRFTRTRIQRILFNSLIGISNLDFEIFNKYGGPQYAKLLGFNKRSRHLLSRLKSTSLIPIITKRADFKSSCNQLIRRMLQIEDLATNMYVLGYTNSQFRKCGQDYTENVIII